MLALRNFMYFLHIMQNKPLQVDTFLALTNGH
jgi:hypothetical protein